MAKSKTTSGGSGGGRKKRSTKLTSDPPVIIGGGSVLVFFKSNAPEIASTRPGYRCFKVPGNIKNFAVFDGTNIVNVPIKNSQSFVAQADE